MATSATQQPGFLPTRHLPVATSQVGTSQGPVGAQSAFFLQHVDFHDHAVCEVPTSHHWQSLAGSVSPSA